MLAFLTKFKTEVRTFINDAHDKLASIETKLDTEFADLKAKVESKAPEATTVVQAAVAQVKKIGTDIKGSV